MTDLRTAAQQALEAMDREIDTRRCKASTLRAMIALRAALAQEQAEQAWVCPDSAEHRYAKPGHCEDCGKTLVLAQQAEPVAWRITDGEGDWDYRTELPEDWSIQWSARYGRKYEPLYTAPPQRKPLTEEEILHVKGQFRGTMNAQFVEFARAIEKAHGIGGQP